MTVSRIFIPADVPSEMYVTYSDNMRAITRETNNVLLFSCDQKIEHLNDDFMGEAIAHDALYPEHMFAIASQSSIGAMVLPFGLLVRYATLFPKVQYIAKLTDSTNVRAFGIKDTISPFLWSVEEVIQCKKDTSLFIRGIEVTVYLGSEYEEDMLKQATHAIQAAHAHGLVAILSIYPKSRELLEEKKTTLLTGICGLANALGADMIVVDLAPVQNASSLQQLLRTAVIAAGNTAIIGENSSIKDFALLLRECSLCIQEKIKGYSVGPLIFQKPLMKALAMTHALSSIIYNGATQEQAMKLYEEKLAGELH